MKLGLTVLLLLAWPLTNMAQGSRDFSRNDLLSFSSFSIYGQEGWNKSKVLHQNGVTPITPLTTRTWSGNFEYNRPFSPKLAAVLGVGGGALAFDFYVKGSGDDEKNRQTAFNLYIPYRKLCLGVEHRSLLSNKYLIAPSIHFGILSGNRVEYGTESSIGFGPDSSVTVSQTRVRHDDARPHLYFDVRIRLGKFLPWNDVLGGYLGYRHGLDVVRTMEYRAYPNVPKLRGEGIYLHRGSELYAGLSYTFNNYKKRKRQSQLAQEGGKSPKDIRVQRKRELETLRSNGYRIAVISGFGMIKEGFEQGYYYNSKMAGPSEHLGLSVSRQMNRGFIGGHFLYNNFYTKYSATGVLWYTQSTNINPVQLGAFAGTYWRSMRKHKRYLTVQGGLDAGFNSYFKKNDTMGSYWEWNDTDTLMATTFMEHPIYPLLHFGIGTSVRLYDQLYWDFGVTYYQGFFKVYREEFEYRNFEGIDGVDLKTSFGSYWAFKTGLSIHIHESKIFKKRKKIK